MRTTWAMVPRTLAQARRATLLAAKQAGAFSWARRATRGRLRILCYHGFQVADESEFRPQMFVSHELLARRMDILGRLGATLMSLREGIRRLRDGTLPDLPVVVTIDDGWASTMRVALPVFRQRQVPVTLYVTTYYMQKQVPVFGMVVQYLLWKSGVDSVEFPGSAGAKGLRVNLRDHEDRERAIDAFVDEGGRSGSETIRQRMVAELAERLGLDYQEIVRSRLLSMMTEQELRIAAGQGLDLQLHTHRHHFPLHDRDVARREILENREILAQIATGPLDHFCYPSGVYGPSAAAVLKELAVASATTCEPGLNTASTDVYALRRFLDGAQVTDLEFESEVSGFRELFR